MSPLPAPGTLVRLRFCPYGQPGIVVGHARGRVLVDWRDLGITRKHPPESLLPVESTSAARLN